MKKIFLLIFIAVICSVIYFIRPGQTSVAGISVQDTLRPTGNVSRVISLCKHPIPFILLGLDASEKRLVGINPDAKISMQSNVLNKYFPDFQKTIRRSMFKSICT